MQKKIQEIIDLIKEKDIKMVDFKMVDIHGQFRHVTIPAYSFSEEIMTTGIGFDASNYGYAVGAMTKTVLPFIRLSIPLWTMDSVRVSMLEVASSKIITGGSATATRAIDKSCL